MDNKKNKADLPDFSADVKANFANSSFAHKVGIRLLEVGAGYASVETDVTEELLNNHGTAHGGAIFTLADTAFGLASNTRGHAVAMQVSINYTRAAKSCQTLRATAVEEAVTRKTGTYNVTVANEAEETVALFRGVVYRKE